VETTPVVSFEPKANNGNSVETAESETGREVTFTVYSNGPAIEERAYEPYAPSHHVHAVEGKFTLAQPVREPVSKDGSSESMLRSIHKVVDDLSASVGHQSLPFSMSDEMLDASWESIETPPAIAKPENRPFRYLFSKLRRKQQGLT
jgi:hypothetical protein